MQDTTFIRHTPRAAWLILAACAVVFVLHAAWFWPWAEDDAFITFRYGAHVAFGVGFEFNTDEAVEGYSNFLWVLLAAAVIKLGGDPLLVARIVGLASGLATLFVAWRLALSLIGRSSLTALLAPAFLAVTPVLPRHSVTGLETAFHTLLLAGLVALVVTRPPDRTATGVVITAILLGFSRPEGWVFAAVLLAWRAFGRLFQGIMSRGVARFEWGIFAGVMIAYLAWRLSTFGYWVPNTGHAKMTGETAALVEGYRYVLDFLGATGGVVLVGLYAVNLAAPRTWLTWIPLTVVVLMQVSFTILAGGDWMHFHRFFAPVMPMIGAGMAGGLAVLAAAIARAGWAERWKRAARATVGLALVLTLAGVVMTERAASSLVLPWVKDGAYMTDAYRETARWIDKHVAPDQAVAVCDIGVLGWELDREIDDMFGLVEPHIAHLPGLPHLKTDPDFVLRHDPGVIVLVRAADGGYLRVPDQAMAAHPEFAARYALTHTIPVGFRDETVEIYLPKPLPQKPHHTE